MTRMAAYGVIEQWIERGLNPRDRQGRPRPRSTRLPPRVGDPDRVR